MRVASFQTLSLAGLCSGLTEAIVICPFEVVKVRLQSERNVKLKDVSLFAYEWTTRSLLIIYSVYKNISIISSLSFLIIQNCLNFINICISAAKYVCNGPWNHKNARNGNTGHLSRPHGYFGSSRRVEYGIFRAVSQRQASFALAKGNIQYIDIFHLLLNDAMSIAFTFKLRIEYIANSAILKNY